ncbi:MAG: ScpA family protein [Acidimicrobiaceae bacterium]|nr:ScpA family protein [Acidimicrobiaceae bacterium]
MTHEVHTEAFAGPLDVLVKLVVSQEVDIWEVSLTRLVDDFVAVMAAMDDDHPEHEREILGDAVGHTVGDGRIDIDAASEFALLAATLIELKSRRLLPAPPVELDLEEELAAYGLRDTAFARLVEGRTFGAAASLMRERWDAAALRWPRSAGPPESFLAFAPDLLTGASRDDLAAAMERVLAPRPVPQVDLSHLRAAGITVDEAAAKLVDRLASMGSATFRELTSEITERVVVVVFFLAVLELFGSGLVELTQAERFGDIGVEWIGEGVALPSSVGGYGEDAA